MNKTAYLVIFLDVSTNPPTFKGAGIYSEATPSVMNFKIRPITIASETSSRGFDVARKRLAVDIQTNQVLGWVLPYLRRSPVDGSLG